ncbi:MAG TPA: phage regulatory CII family protein [Methylophilus sp.]|uniref:phage regulatory CII family protein n=1 Tax=Methylophilus sp. TaxID=29541 RepID=UPI002D05520C|nr:phage regulatory CII family protein [Methylophilus sp.]HSH86870.1 phage regulatory CII family protein [Methylophilus sp.]
MELTALLQMLVANTPHGLDIALAEINKNRVTKMSAQVLNNKLNPYFDNDHLNAPQIDAIIRALNLDLPLAQHSAEKANAVVMSLPSVPEGDIEISNAFMDMTRELGETCAKFQKYYSDKHITRNEFKDISSEFNELLETVVKAKSIVKAIVR